MDGLSAVIGQDGVDTCCQWTIDVFDGGDGKFSKVLYKNSENLAFITGIKLCTCCILDDSYQNTNVTYMEKMEPFSSEQKVSVRGLILIK
jgi:hypothetical protein